MPNFELNKPARKTPPHAYYGLDEFAQGYVEAMFFTNGDCGSDDADLLNRLGVERLTREACASIKADCDNFLFTAMPDGCFARQWIDRLAQGGPGRYGEGVQDDTRAGHMFYYARQGHGVGWGDDYAPVSPGDAVDLAATAEGLQNACYAFGEATVDTYRGWISHS